MKRKIRIVYVIDVLDTHMAGTENQLIKMINGIDKDRFDVHLVCFRNCRWFRRNASMLQCDATVFGIQNFKRLSTYANILRLVRFFRGHRPDVVHTFFPVANIVAVIAARLAGVRNIVSSRRDYGEWMKRRYLLLTRVANRFVSMIVANATTVKALTVSAERVPSEKVEVLYNGIELGPFGGIQRDQKLKQTLGIPEGNLVVGIVANFRPMKRHYTFVRAAAEIVRARSGVDFLLIGGTGSKKQETEALARSLGVYDKMHFLGSQSDVVPYLSIMNVGVNCSEREGLSNAIMEYMAAGIPSVVTRSGGNLDLIEDGVNGFTFELDDYQALARLVLRLLDDEALRRRLGENAHEKVEREMTVTTMLSNYESLYERLSWAS